MEYEWLGNWMWTREHAVRPGVLANRFNRHFFPICNSVEVYTEPQHDAAAMNRDKGETPKCRRCLALIEREGE